MRLLIAIGIDAGDAPFAPKMRSRPEEKEWSYESENFFFNPSRFMETFSVHEREWRWDWRWEFITRMVVANDRFESKVLCQVIATVCCLLDWIPEWINDFKNFHSIGAEIAGGIFFFVVSVVRSKIIFVLLVRRFVRPSLELWCSPWMFFYQCLFECGTREVFNSELQRESFSWSKTALCNCQDHSYNSIDFFVFLKSESNSKFSIFCK